MKVLSLSRYAVKGLGPDYFDSINIDKAGEAFPDDRRYALIKTKNLAKFNPDVSEWIFKQNFLCAFTYGKILNHFVTKYDDATNELTVWKRNDNGQKSDLLLGSVNISTKAGQERLAGFFEEKCGEPLTFVTSNSSDHQFGNTESGFNKRQDSRTIHIVNASTVREVETKLGVKLSAEQFRPNIIVDGLQAWNDFDAVGKTMTVSRPDGTVSTLQFVGLTRCVRCDGIGVDPLDPSKPQVDIPKLLAKNYPEHGPYLGIYVVVTNPGDIQVGDTITFPGEKVSSIPKASVFQNNYIWAAVAAGVALLTLSVYGKKNNFKL